MPRLDLDDVFAAYRESQGPDAQEREATWAQLQTRIRDGDTGPRLRSGPRPAPTRRPMAFALAVAAVALAAVSLAAYAIGSGQLALRSGNTERHNAAPFESVKAEEPARVETRDPAPRPRPRRAGASTPHAEPTVEDPQQYLEPLDQGPQPRSRRPPKRLRTAPPRAAPPPEPQPVRPEDATRLLDARAALARRDPQATLAITREHARRFPESTYAPEREALQVLALCALQRPVAPERLQAFLKQHPNSPLIGRVKRACARRSD